MTAEVAVRDARPGEIETVSRLLTTCYQEFRPLIAPAAWAAYIREIGDVQSRLPDAELVVAEQGGKLIGAVCFYADASRSALERWPPGWAGFRTLGVDPSARGAGVGELLVEECLRRARAAGARTVGLHTMPFMAAAIGLYERLGFRPAPELDLPISGRVVKAFRLDLD